MVWLLIQRLIFILNYHLKLGENNANVKLSTIHKMSHCGSQKHKKKKTQTLIIE